MFHNDVRVPLKIENFHDCTTRDYVGNWFDRLEHHAEDLRLVDRELQKETNSRPWQRSMSRVVLNNRVANGLCDQQDA